MTTSEFIDVVMPQMGVSVTEGVIARWHVAVGDRVVSDQIVCEVSTDKTDTEILAPADGVITEIIVSEGEEVAIGGAVARLSSSEGAGGSGPAVAPATSVAATPVTPPHSPEPPASRPSDVVPAPLVAPVTDQLRTSHRSVAEMLAGARIDPTAAADAVLDHRPSDGRPLASPLAQRRAKERNIDLGEVRGTGRRGRICVQDVLAAGRTTSVSATSVAPATAVTATPVTPTIVVGEAGLPLGYEDVPFAIAKTSPHRRAISEHMIRSRQTAAHMTTEVDVDMFQVAKVREMMNAARAGAGQGRISYLSFITKAAIAALADYPDMNATFQHERIIHWNEVNVGIAVDTPEGLIVPVIRHADTMTVEGIADSIARLAERARARRLSPDDLRAGTFTVSNPGSVGGVAGPAIINQPQVAILGIPVIVRRPWVVTSAEGGEAVAIRPILRLAVTFDHRAIDGAYATRYVVQVGRLLESWDLRDYS